MSKILTDSGACAAHVPSPRTAARQETPAAVGRMPVAATPATPAAARTGVLVVDDEDLVRDTVRRILARHHQVSTAADLDQARHHLAGGDIDVVLCDIRMGGGSGLDLLREIVSDHPGVAVVMVTGLDDPALAEEALAAGACGYLLKPFTASQLRITVACALRRREADQARELAEAQVRDHQLAAERDRIAARLYRDVLHHLFGIGLNLTSAAKATGDDTACARMMSAVHDLDTIIKRIRSSVLNPHDA